MNGQWVVEPLFSVFQDDVRNEAHQDHEPNQGHKHGKRILVPWMPDQKLRVIGIAQETAPPAETSTARRRLEFGPIANILNARRPHRGRAGTAFGGQNLPVQCASGEQEPAHQMRGVAAKSLAAARRAIVRTRNTTVGFMDFR